MNRYGIYWGEDVMSQEGYRRVPIIESILWEGDTVFIIGKEKAGKSILTLQMACALTSGEDFLDCFRISRQYEVLYVQTEGKRDETQERLYNMTQGMQADLSKFTHVFLPSIGLDTSHGIKLLKNMLEQNNRNPEVIFIDPLYMSMEGDMKDSKASRHWISNVRGLVGDYNATLIVVHHAHRGIRNKQTGDLINEGDDAAFGSFVWKAFPDHIFMFYKNAKNHVLSCGTQRSAKIIKSIDCVLHHPTPLLFTTEDSDSNNSSLIVLNFISEKGKCTADDIITGTKIPRPTVYRGLRKLLNGHAIVKTKTRPVYYHKS